MTGLFFLLFGNYFFQSADELEKMKVQSQFQSQVQSVVKKDDTKVSDNQVIIKFVLIL